jgi:hypothetical protein
MSYVSEEKVRQVFNDLFECECVKEVKLVPVGKDGKDYNVCFIHFHEMPVDPELGNGKWILNPDQPGAHFELVPDPHKTNRDGKPYFWKVFLNKKAKPVIQ